ncbi:MAG TPA: LysR family transcriptional regulator [Phenylobacterium sp.]|nr:LysR family transcriptional regulator [Phenylobacterium sp.]
MQYRRMDWDDLRYMLAVARSGSALSAARVLGVNQSTVIRRIVQAECAVGAQLFERQRTGYRLTELGRQVVETAERVEAEITTLTNLLEAQQRALGGVVRLTLSETLANRLVAPGLLQFQKRYPAVLVELITEDRRLDLARGEADIALRAGSRPEGAGVVARRMPDAAWNLYCSRAYAAENGAPARREEIPGHAIIGMEGRMAGLPAPLWLQASAPDTFIRFRSNSLTNLVSNLRAGLGLATLPCFVGDGEPDLMRCLPHIPELDSEVWLVIREDLRATPHIRAFADFLADYVHGQRARLSGAA